MRVSTIRLAKLSNQLKELRIHLCQTDGASKGAREFVEKYYVGIKKDNPKLPILIRECGGTQPRLWARFEMGKEKSVPLTNLSGADVAKQIEVFGK